MQSKKDLIELIKWLISRNGYIRFRGDKYICDVCDESHFEYSYSIKHKNFCKIPEVLKAAEATNWNIYGDYPGVKKT